MKPKKNRASGRPTLADVAKRAGVSEITASRAMRGVKTVGPELAEAVKQAAKAVGYIPDPAARALASKRSRSILVLIPALSNQLFIGMYEEIQKALRAEDYEIFLGNYHYDARQEEKLIRDYLVYRPSGVLLTGNEQSAAATKMLKDSGLPCVYMMDLLETPGTISIGFSQEEAGAAVARHLIATGRRKLAYIAAQLDPRAKYRGQGFQREIARHGLEPAIELRAPIPSSPGLGADQFRSILGEYPDRDGLFFCNDDLAWGALMEASRLQIDIPERFSIVGFNDLPLSAHMAPRLTSVKTPLDEIGRHGAVTLLRLVRGQPVESACCDLGFELKIRESSLFSGGAAA
ncbi:LacI family DNA-binding transcriptional regulator [uncultured Martelella sp.]|uniref:LacI family DNA-binding transcriptional regulator n=1 Tax=uncultured Martelella sp. TaxID=392331 RepID=UPI0029C701A0|nr:LacI family DNA-binding transcriptional regulator [uncultured Martelella sp.]